MTRNDFNNQDMIDADLYEQLTDEELAIIMEEATRKRMAQQLNDDKEIHVKKHRKWVVWLIFTVICLNIIAFLPQTYSIPAIEFLKKSAQLSKSSDIKAYKKAVVVIETADGKGTGFTISPDGTILTNYHVIEGNEKVTVAFTELGLFEGNVVATYPEIDLAVVKVEGENLPYLEREKQPVFNKDAPIHFIGNPLSFKGIANEGTILESLQLSDWKQEVIMIKAPVYRGNSGSPVINASGKVIGIVFATIENPIYGNVGLFIPINYYQDQ